MSDQWYYHIKPEYLAYLGSKAWKELRAKVIERCGNVCERCGKYLVTEVHHLSYARIYHEDLEDLQGVCPYCHDFLHRKRRDDGTAEHARLEKEREETRARVANGQAELQRLTDSPALYRVFTAAPLPAYIDLMRMLRQHPRVVADREGRIADVRYARRKYVSAVAFKLRLEVPGGHAELRVPSAEDWLRGGVAFDTERQAWVDTPRIRWFSRRSERA